MAYHKKYKFNWPSKNLYSLIKKANSTSMSCRRYVVRSCNSSSGTPSRCPQNNNNNNNQSISEFRQQALVAHNNYRRNHNVQPLILNDILCNYAQEWANVTAARATIQHRTNNSYGENIYYYYSSDPNAMVHGKDAVDAWYNEISQHVFYREPSSMSTGHFTQVVWKDSRQLGVGMCKNVQGQVFVVANYDPPGNYVGKYSVSVPPVGGF